MTFQNVDWKDVWERAYKTFIQAAIPYLLAAVGGVNFAEGIGGTVLIGIAISACAAGVSAVWNGVLAPIVVRPKPPDAVVVEVVGEAGEVGETEDDGGNG